MCDGVDQSMKVHVKGKGDGPFPTLMTRNFAKGLHLSWIDESIWEDVAVNSGHQPCLKWYQISIYGTDGVKHDRITDLISNYIWK